MQRDRRNVRLSLASLDTLGDDAQMRAQAEQVVQERDAHPESDVHVGRDQSGSFEVLVDDDAQVQDVTVERDWRARIGPAAVGQALFEAYVMAVQSAVETAAVRQMQQEPPVAPRAGSEPRSGAADEVDEHVWLRRVWQTLDSIDTDLERLWRPSDAPTEQTITSPHGGLTAQLRSGGIVAVTSDPARVAGLDAGQLRFEARSLLRTCAVIRSGDRS